MVEMIPRITVYTNKLRVTETHVKKIAVIDGVDSRAEKDLTRAIMDAFKDQTVNKVVLMRSYVPEHESN